MAFLKRVLSSDYRRALAAEAAGEYLEAARAYALAGERIKVAEMHLLLAERAAAPDGRLAEVRAALRWADAGDEAKPLRRRIGRALLTHVHAIGTRSERDLMLLREAAGLLSGADDHAGAGECYELAGDDAQAAESYQQAGEVERLEVVLAREEQRDQRSAKLRAAFDEYRLLDGRGERDRALAHLQECTSIDPGGASRELLMTLTARLITDGKVTLGIGGAEPERYAGVLPFALGRDPSCGMALHEAGVSRRHAEIVDEGGRFRLRDAGSRNGTRLGGVVIEGELPLDGEGEIGLGPDCAVRFSVDGSSLRLEVLRGRDRGMRVHLCRLPVQIAGGLATLRFGNGRPLLTPAAGVTLRLGGHRSGDVVQLVRGDALELARVAGPSDHCVRIDVGT